MSKDCDQRFLAGQEWARLRKKNAEPGSPCLACKRSACPPVCFPRRGYHRRNKGKKGGEEV